LFSSFFTIIVLVGQTGLVSGRVEDARSGQGVAGVSVTIASTSAGAATNDAGAFLLGPLRPGRYCLVASHIAYEPETTVVELYADYVARPLLTLRARVIPMPEVRAQTSRREPEEKVTVREISAERLQRQAGSFVQDPIRSLSFLPGVAPSTRGEWSGSYVVRGGEPDESSVWFGDVELLWPYHLLGFSSIVNPDIVEKISFYPSALPTRYGGVVSSIAVMKPKDLTRGEGFWAYDPLNLRAACVGNLDDIRFLGSVRRTYYNVLFGPMGAGSYNRPSYSDFAGQIALPLGAGTKLRGTVVSGTDQITSPLRGVETEMTESGTSLAATAESDIGAGRSTFTVYSSTHDFVLSPSVWWGTAVTRQHEYGLRSDLSLPLNQQMSLGAGAELSRQGYVGNLMAATSLQRADNGYALYATFGLRPVRTVGFDCGLRFEDVRWASDRVLEPRAVLSWFPTDRLSFKAGFRRHAQHSYSFLRSSCAAFVFDQEYDGYRLFELGLLEAKLADHYSFSGEFRFRERTRLALDAYFKEYSRLPTWQADNQGRLSGVGNSGTGFARGVELTFEQGPVSGWSGWLTYALAWTRKQQGADTMLYWDRSDRRHALNLTAQKAFGDGWALSATFTLNTGAAYTPLLYTQSPNDTRGADLNRGNSRYVIEGEKNSARVPLYHRLDLKLSRDLPKLPLHPFVYIEILNVYNRQNAYYLVQFEDRNGTIVTGQSTGIPFIPLIGIGGRF
jgi:hypothetical protein